MTVPVLIALGIGCYFSGFIDIELVYSVVFSGFLLIFALIMGNRFSFIKYILLAIFFISLGYSAVKYRIYSINTVTLEKELRPTMVTGIVDNVHQYEDGKLRLTLRDTLISGIEPLNLVNIRVNQYAEMPFSGDKVQIRAGLMAPPGPAQPEDYDYARQIWFQNISAVGYGVSPLIILEKSTNISTSFNQLRQRMAQRIQSQIKGQAGSLAAALITGIRGSIPRELTSAMRNAGLAHLLAISGLHMGLLCGVVFYLARLTLSRFPTIVLNYPIKKYAAIIASLSGLGYLLLSGASVPTVRAFIMVLVVFIGILTDRRAISLRLVAIAAIIILLINPEALIGVSFQMSFAAVVALVIVFEKFGTEFLNSVRGDNQFHHKIFYFILASLLTSLISEIAIAPFALYHFNKLALFGLLANLIAMPVMGSWVMPWIVASLLLMPLGLEKLALVPMSWGLEVIMKTAYFVSELPGATLSLAAIDAKGLVLLVIGALWLGIWRLKWRYLGIPVMVGGVLIGALTAQPDILIDNGGKLIGLRGEDNSISLSKLNASRIVKDRWRQRLGQDQVIRWEYDTFAPENSNGRELSCDTLSCLYRPLRANDMLISLVQNEQALLEDCQNADVIISLVAVEINCPARLVLDRWDFYNNGGYAIWLPSEKGGALKVENVKQSRGNFPWVN